MISPSVNKSTPSDPNAVIAHAAAHGLGAVWPWSVLIAVAVVGSWCTSSGSGQADAFGFRGIVTKSLSFSPP